MGKQLGGVTAKFSHAKNIAWGTQNIVSKTYFDEKQ
jgi:hypothetical protein